MVRQAHHDIEQIVILDSRERTVGNIKPEKEKNNEDMFSSGCR
jgi:hypothetical protein